MKQSSDLLLVRAEIDAFDPRFIDFDCKPDEFIIRLCNRDANLVAHIDEEDYGWARQYIWGYCHSKLNLGRTEKFYAKCRVKEEGGYARIYLHKAICQRAHGDPPSSFHTIADHRDGESLNCRRMNLRWATPRMNRINIRGAYPHDLIEG